MKIERKGHHSVITPDGDRFRKYIEPWVDRTPTQLTELRDLLEGYHVALRALGIPVANEHEVRIESAGELGAEMQGLCVVESTQHCGTSGYAIIRGAVCDPHLPTPVEVIDRITEALLPVLSQTEWAATVDPHPGNWCFDHDGVMRYVDFYPPRYRYRGELVVWFPNLEKGPEYDHAIRRYFTAERLIRLLRFSAVRGGGREMETVISHAIERYPVALRERLTQHLAALPEQRVRAGEDVRTVLEPLTVWDVDDIREIALCVADRIPDRDAVVGFLESVLELTRVNHALSTQQRVSDVEKAKTAVREYAAQSSMSVTP